MSTLDSIHLIHEWHLSTESCCGCSIWYIFNKNVSRMVAYYWQKVHLWDAVETFSPALGDWPSWGIVFQCAVWAPDVYSREVEVGGGRGRRYQALAPRCEKIWHSLLCFLLGTVRPSLPQQWSQKDVSFPSNTLTCTPSFFLFLNSHSISRTSVSQLFFPKEWAKKDRNHIAICH